MDELYDLAHDPHEIDNVANNSAARSTLDDMKGGLQQLLNETR